MSDETEMHGAARETSMRQAIIIAAGQGKSELQMQWKVHQQRQAMQRLLPLAVTSAQTVSERGSCSWYCFTHAAAATALRQQCAHILTTTCTRLSHRAAGRAGLDTWNGPRGEETWPARESKRSSKRCSGDEHSDGGFASQARLTASQATGGDRDSFDPNYSTRRQRQPQYQQRASSEL